jgi:putative transposase
MIRIQLDETTRDDLHRLRHTNLSNTARDRLEMILLSDAGWSLPRIARHLGCHPHTTRDVLNSYRDRGVAALQPQRPGPPPELNEIEPVFKQVKHHDIPVRCHTSKTELRTSVKGGFATRAKHPREKSDKSPRWAA